jgi:hypothetical protein
MKVAVAVKTLAPGVNVTVAVAVEDPNVPANGVLITFVGCATPWVTTFTSTTVPSGMLVAARLTVNRLGRPGSKMTPVASKMYRWDSPARRPPRQQ